MNEKIAFARMVLDLKLSDKQICYLNGEKPIIWKRREGQTFIKLYELFYDCLMTSEKNFIYVCEGWEKYVIKQFMEFNNILSDETLKAKIHKPANLVIMNTNLIRFVRKFSFRKTDLNGIKLEKIIYDVA